MPANDQLTLGGFTFSNFSTPNEIGAGGKQQMVIHKLPGGTRVIDTFGPDEANIVWSGIFYDNSALDMALQLDSMRAKGSLVSLSFAGQQRQVVIDEFAWSVQRLPFWLKYSISCTVYKNPQQGAGGGAGSGAGAIQSLVNSDLSSAAAAGG